MHDDEDESTVDNTSAILENAPDDSDDEVTFNHSSVVNASTHSPAPATPAAPSPAPAAAETNGGSAPKKARKADKKAGKKAEGSGKKAASGGGGGSSSKKMSKLDKEMTVCSTLISEMENHEEAGPFLYPVNTKQFPTYKKVVKHPMDITTIKKKLESAKDSYKCRDDFVSDVRLIFSNCELFNEDDSPVGKAGYAMRDLFETRWAELTS